MDGYAVFVDSHMHCALKVNETQKYIHFIMLDIGVVDVYRMDHDRFYRTFRDEIIDYPLAHYAQRMLNLQPDLGVTVTPSARAHLNHLLHTEAAMPVKIPTKMAEEPAPKAKLVPTPAPKVAVKPTPAPKGVTAKAPEVEEGEETAAKVRTPKLADNKIKKIADHTARQGTLRAAIMDAILSAKSVHEALATEVEHPTTGAGYKIKAVDVHFAVNNGWIELV